MTGRTLFRRSPRARGFSLIELLLAIFILGVGVISVAAVFPAGIIQQRRAQDDVLGPVVAEAALATLRSKLSQDDFGTFEDFGVFRDQVGAWVEGGQVAPDSSMQIFRKSLTAWPAWPAEPPTPKMKSLPPRFLTSARPLATASIDAASSS